VKSSFCLTSILAFFALLVFAVMGICHFAFAEPEVSQVTVTDVTQVSFSVIWASSEPSTSGLNLFQDEDGTLTVENITIESQPVKSGDMIIAGAAEDNGVMKVRVSGLTADTTYYFQTVTTSKSSGDITYFPDSPPMLGVTTENRVVRTKMAGEAELPLTNDLISLECYLPDDVTPAEGTLLVAEVEGCDYPVSGFVGDGITVPYAFVDLNNMFSSQSNQTMALYGGEDLILTRFMGIHGIEADAYFVPQNHQLAEMRSPITVAPCKGDFDTDGDVDGSDLAVFSADFGRTDCKEDGVPYCEGDFDSDGDVDGSDLAVFSADFGRTDCPD
jgi:hypothetical protein